MNNLEKLLYLRRVAAEYFSYSGERVVIPHQQRLKFLTAVGYDIYDEQAVEQAIHELDAVPWQSWLARFNIVSLGDREYIDIRVSEGEIDKPLEWQIQAEDGTSYSGHFHASKLLEVGEYIIDGIRYTAHRLPLVGLPLGYHQITVSDQQRVLSAPLIIVPQHCYQGDNPDRRLLGISCQLYTLSSNRNWGIGDFTDLGDLISHSAEADIDMICLNPLHAPHLAGADFASPYSPSDRRFLNPLYIDAEAVAEYSASKKIASFAATQGFKQKIISLRDAPQVNYDGVAELKYWVFEALFEHFVAQEIAKKTARADNFWQFVQQQGEALQSFAKIESGQSVAGISGAAFAAGLKAAKNPQFHQYLQWIACEQLQQCQAQALAAGMAIGLMGDLAVGAVSDGAEVIARPELFCTRASIGAPPDPFSVTGQNWNLPPIDPIALEQDEYQHFISLIRANMRYCGALRIDHVMGLLRLWWCLPEHDGAAATGAYVYYPFEALLAIIRLESYRNRCVVIGEDMGVVPDEVRDQMAATSMYTNKLFYFEREYLEGSHQQSFMRPEHHPVNSLLMVTNHDVSTLAGWWDAADLQLRSDIGFDNAKEQLPALLDERRADKLKVLDWLAAQQLLPSSWSAELDDVVLTKAFDLALCAAMLATCARSASRLMSFQLDDLQLMKMPVNIPGTYREYPNWRRKQLQQTNTVFAKPEIQTMLAAMVCERNKVQERK